ncbi:hypothetical protein MSAN_00988800 [Mycena sanguinolenta]|uniref:Uncharacterized protein n=1 Tax=Mycena sanguinolenta TaxID=230812 RepID=A0A8H6YRQ6_9AGAR|nr:hypothetical protein MSAN_00988800 [Mycena sanguinolenta]
MLAIVSPQPNPATAAAAIYSVMTPPQRLQSPVLLDTRLRSPLCSSPHRRRTARPRPHRRRHCARAECPIESALHPFDRLPWISAMDASPDALDLADIADLSQLDVDEPPQDCGAVPLATGPIRRRKTSLRASPLPPKITTHTLHDTTPPYTHLLTF